MGKQKNDVCCILKFKSWYPELGAQQFINCQNQPDYQAIYWLEYHYIILKISEGLSVEWKD